MRNLVTIRRIDTIRPIPDADAIECATTEGWEIVIKKGEFQPGEACIYFEIDSFLPAEDPRYDFLMKNKTNWEGREGVRLRTVKLRGQISQGLALSREIFPELREFEHPRDRQVDLSDRLGILKWEAPIPASLAGEVEGAMPSFIRKTDQERIQNLAHLLHEQRDQAFEVTVKLDGSSITLFRQDQSLGVCGRNWWLRETASNTLWRVARRDRVLEALEAYGRNLALQGELVGEGIQGNNEKLKGQHIYLYDIFDIDRQAYLGREARSQAIAGLRERGASIEEVPFLEVTTLDRFGGDMKTILAYAEGSSLNPQRDREGVVFKRLDGEISFKAIANKYLIKNADR
ncbi:hypothetical protein GCM10007874_37890 [Labrys miyagiensis]|uniref:RNA ligase domain-containing protein n=1 Tax=Labrys miyagiensis TaxID=346912 RepID=A0ABQ6CR84_9HYPH|nr:RNA ligase (ATP) [Labrys miyagiensis]GLS20772.1 hypothetical protein GCM10007874_37890 [Labrys miyagiensis]